MDLYGSYGPWRGWYGPAYTVPYAPPYGANPDDELQILRNEAEAIRDELQAINSRIEELEAESPEK
jgi:hypothetical protein